MAQNLTTLASVIPVIFKGVQNYMDGHVADRLGHAMINLATKFEVPIFTRYGNIKCVALWGG